MCFKEISNTFVDRVRRFASVHDLFVKGGKYIVALSGGADSVAMLLVMKSISNDLNLTIEAAHCNFHLRGEESMRDERFCKELCLHLDVPFHVIHFDTLAYAELHHVSVEMAARDLRYSYFENLRHDIEAQDICVAHHRDDSVETVLLNLVRGTGLRGLRGIQPRNANIIRPLLSVSRNDIRGYLDVLGQDYVTDSTNQHNDVKRNKIRLDVMPLLRELNPSVAQSIFDSSVRVAEGLKVFDRAIQQSISEVRTITDNEGGFCLDVSKLKEQASPEYTLYETLNPCGFSSSRIEQIYYSLERCTTGKVFESDTHELTFDRGKILIQKKTNRSAAHRMRIPEPGTYVYNERRKLKVEKEEWGTDCKPSRHPDCVCLDASKITFPLILRHAEQGDRFMPFGMNGMKLVSDYLTDRKKNLFQKRAQLVVEDANGNICWLVGERADNRYRITKETKESIRLKVLLDPLK